MQYISRYNTSFMAYMYKKYHKIFKKYDHYSEFLLRNYADVYYETLERDLKEYCDWQQERGKKNESKDKRTNSQRESC